MSNIPNDAEIGGVLHNKWPCCKRATQWHNMTQYKDGDERTVECPKDGRKWKVTFSITSPFKGMKPFLKLNWEELGGRK